MFTTSLIGIRDNGTWNLEAAIVKGTHENQVVKVTDNNTVGLCSAEDRFIGVIISIEIGNEIGVVQEKGYKEISYSGTAPSPGNHVELVANGNGGVKIPATSDTGNHYVVASVDTDNETLMLRLG